MAGINFARKHVFQGQSVSSAEDLIPSDAEIYYLWGFIQGSIMIPSTRAQLRRAWGMCERHAFLAVAVDCAHRRTFLHGPAILYHDLMERASAAFDTPRSLKAAQVSRRLAETQPCLMCDMGYDAQKPAPMSLPHYIESGRDQSHLRAFARDTQVYWRSTVCGACAESSARPLCRIHLREQLTAGKVNLAEQKQLITSIFEHITRYYRSFWWEMRGTETVEDRAALISAIGWCSGWRPWLMLMHTED